MDELVRSFRAQLLGDERLAHLVTAGSDAAFSTLYKRYQRPLYRYCRSILRSDADAHDAVQSTFARAFEALRRGQRDAPVRPWLYRIAYNESVTLIRAHRAGDKLSGYLTPYVARPDDRAHDREQLGSLLEDLQELPERSRGAILMRELGGLSHEEIAAALGTSVNGAKQAIFEARVALTDFAAGRDMACEDVREAISLGDRRVLRGRRVSAHLRDCPACAQFAAEFTGRRGRLRVLWPPLPAGPATTLLARLGLAGSNVEAGAPAAGAGLLGGVANSFSAVIVTATGALMAAGLVAGVGTAGVQAVQQAGHRASVGVRPASLLFPTTPTLTRAADATNTKVGAGQGPRRIVTGAPTSSAAGEAPGAGATSRSTPGPSAPSVPTTGERDATTAPAPVRPPTASTGSGARGEPPRGAGANRGRGVGAGVSRRRQRQSGASRIGRPGHATGGSPRRPRSTSRPTDRGQASPEQTVGRSKPAQPPSRGADGSPASSTGNKRDSGGSAGHDPAVVPPAVKGPLEGAAGAAKDFPQAGPVAGRS